MNKRLGLRPRVAGLITFAAIAAAALFVAPSAFASVNGAAFTTDNPGYVEATTPTYTDQSCLNGPVDLIPGVNCNIYGDKRDVWTNGGPSNGQNHLSDGTYFFAVLEPGGQPDPNDGSAKNLSSPNDAYTNRTFTVFGGHISDYTGSHNQDSTYGLTLGTLIQLAPYDDTTNPGGVYILAICSLGADGTSYPVDPRDCKYDAFKIKAGGCDTDCGPPVAADPFGSKSAIPGFTREFNWTILKGVDVCQVTVANTSGCQITGSSKTLNYNVTLTKTKLGDSGFGLTGDITVTNPDAVAVTGLTVTDATNAGGTCTVSLDLTFGLDPTGDALPAGGTADYPYTCDFGSTNPGPGTNTATVSWDPNLSDGSVTLNSTFPATADFSFVTPTTVIHDSVDVSDLITSTNPTLPSTGYAVGGAVGDLPSGTWNASHTFSYSRTLTVPHGCLTVNNTASFAVHDATDGDADDSGNSSVTAKVCRVAANTGALTMGFWQNKNGQGIVTTGASTSGVCNSGTWLRLFAPFQDLSSTATCSQVATYVYNVIKAATCTSAAKTCNTMLKAQDLATSLDVYFSDPALGGNKIGAFNGKGNTQQPIGNLQVDLTQVCNMVDGTSGSGTCSGVFQDASIVFGGNACLSVYKLANATDILRYAASQSNLGGTIWYGQTKANQVLAKNVFDAINNQAAFSCT
jgi:hypothetical protein